MCRYSLDGLLDLLACSGTESRPMVVRWRLSIFTLTWNRLLPTRRGTDNQASTALVASLPQTVPKGKTQISHFCIRVLLFRCQIFSALNIMSVCLSMRPPWHDMWYLFGFLGFDMD
uniref:Uncharacterized protein n=1 Tax=Aegilops tauschii subsp. strangulata TaxID=200361 RepID=A0A453LBL6_AEGTS